MYIRKNPQLTPFINVLNNHSDTVGEAVYNKKSYVRRAEFVNKMSNEEGISTQESVTREDDEELKAKRQKLDADDMARSVRAAQELIKKDKMRRNLNSSCRVKPDHRQFLQTVMKNSTDLEVHVVTRSRFPSDKVWKKTWNRFVDTVESPVKEKVLEIEKTIFDNTKKEVLKQMDLAYWSGSKSENSLADYKVAMSVKGAFRYYESSKDVEDETYFKM